MRKLYSFSTSLRVLLPILVNVCENLRFLFYAIKLVISNTIDSQLFVFNTRRF